jgi:tRNA (cmo5U34)-methyltransferase
MQQLFSGEVFANTADFDTGIRQLLTTYDEMFEVITRCLTSTNRRILECRGYQNDKGGR